MGTYERTMLKLEKMAQANTASGQKWQKMMSDTSHQREVKDLVNAGLNPVLSSGGSGAQGYTTTVDSAVNGIAGMASAREGASATRYAARQSAAATRAAAAAQMEAARIAADASKYNTDAQERMNRDKLKNQLEIVNKTPPKNIAEFAWKLVDQTGLRDAAIGNNMVKFVSSQTKKMLDNPISYFKGMKSGAVSLKNYVLNDNGFKNVSASLKSIGIIPSKKTVDLFVKAFIFNQPYAIYALRGYIPKKTSSSSSRR